VPATRVREVSHMLKAIHAQENRDAADRKARAIVEDLRPKPSPDQMCERICTLPLSEISSALVARILDWSGGTCLSAYAGPTGIAALFRPQDICFTESTRRNNRCACVLTAPQLGTISAAKDSQPTALQLIVAGQQAPCQRAVKDLMIP
jgi:hypothetical protein